MFLNIFSSKDKDISLGSLICGFGNFKLEMLKRPFNYNQMTLRVISLRYNYIHGFRINAAG